MISKTKFSLTLALLWLSISLAGAQTLFVTNGPGPVGLGWPTNAATTGNNWVLGTYSFAWNTNGITTLTNSYYDTNLMTPRIDMVYSGSSLSNVIFSLTNSFFPPGYLFSLRWTNLTGNPEYLYPSNNARLYNPNNHILVGFAFLNSILMTNYHGNSVVIPTNSQNTNGTILIQNLPATPGVATNSLIIVNDTTNGGTTWQTHKATIPQLQSALGISSGAVTNYIDSDALAYYQSAHLQFSSLRDLNNFVLQLKSKGVWTNLVDYVFLEGQFFNTNYPLSLKLRPVCGTNYNVFALGTYFTNTTGTGVWLTNLPPMTSASMAYAFQAGYLTGTGGGATRMSQVGLFSDLSTSNGWWGYLDQYTAGTQNFYAITNGVGVQQQIPYRSEAGIVQAQFNSVSGWYGRSQREFSSLIWNFDSTNVSGTLNTQPLLWPSQPSCVLTTPGITNTPFTVLKIGGINSFANIGILYNVNDCALVKGAGVFAPALTTAQSDAVFQAQRELEPERKVSILFGHSQGCNATYGNPFTATNSFLQFLADEPGYKNEIMCVNHSVAATYFSGIYSYPSVVTNIVWAYRPSWMGGSEKCDAEYVGVNYGYNEQAINGLTNAVQLFTNMLGALNAFPTWVSKSVFNIRVPGTNALPSQLNQWTNPAVWSAALAYNHMLNTNHFGFLVVDQNGLFTSGELPTNNFTGVSGSHFDGPNGPIGNMRIADYLAGKTQPAAIWVEGNVNLWPHFDGTWTTNQ